MAVDACLPEQRSTVMRASCAAVHRHDPARRRCAIILVILRQQYVGSGMLPQRTASARLAGVGVAFSAQHDRCFSSSAYPWNRLEWNDYFLT